MRILITGYPSTGKTTLANEMKNIVCHTDDVIAEDEDWDAQAEEVSYWFDEESSWVIEGVTIPKALRLWLERNENNEEATPTDLLIFLDYPLKDLTEEQKDMSKSINTVMDEIIEDLWRHGVNTIGYT